ncbi:hypothetical protein G15_2616 [Enterococcus avium]|nr:hypothetical protein G15_2616 [Enterococcus avium]
MNIKDFMEIQNAFDEKHGWSNSDSKTTVDTIEQLKNDIVGLVGEVGEFSNIVKKVSRESAKEKTNSFENNIENMNEELVDIFIYLLRIMTTLDIDLEKEYTKKLEFNKRRFKKFE